MLTTVRPSNLSPFQREMIRANLQASHPEWSGEKIEEELKKGNTSEKLIASLEDKKNYVCHYRLLQKYVELGMEVLVFFIRSFYSNVQIKYIIGRVSDL